MASGLTDIRRRILATRQIAKATSALQKVASVRLARVRRCLDDGRLYHARLQELVRDLAELRADADHPFLMPGSGTTSVVVVFGSERGLCGSFNVLLVEALGRLLDSAPAATTRVLVTGKVTARRARRLGCDIIEALPQPPMDDLFRVPSGQPAGPARREDGIRHVADSVMALFLGGQAKDVRVLFSKFVSGLVQRPTIVQALPVPPPALGPAARPGDAAAWARAASFSPGRGEVLAGILPQYVESVLRDAAAQSMASENAARQAAMTRATDNARDMLADLMTQYYRLRQESITRELLEIARGAEAA